MSCGSPKLVPRVPSDLSEHDLKNPSSLGGLIRDYFYSYLAMCSGLDSGVSASISADLTIYNWFSNEHHKVWVQRHAYPSCVGSDCHASITKDGSDKDTDGPLYCQAALGYQDGGEIASVLVNLCVGFIRKDGSKIEFHGDAELGHGVKIGAKVELAPSSDDPTKSWEQSYKWRCGSFGTTPSSGSTSAGGVDH